jgi:hypothetical protein
VRLRISSNTRVILSCMKIVSLTTRKGSPATAVRIVLLVKSTLEPPSAALRDALPNTADARRGQRTPGRQQKIVHWRSLHKIINMLCCCNVRPCART